MPIVTGASEGVGLPAARAERGLGVAEWGDVALASLATQSSISWRRLPMCKLARAQTSIQRSGRSFQRLSMVWVSIHSKTQAGAYETSKNALPTCAGARRSLSWPGRCRVNRLNRALLRWLAQEQHLDDGNARRKHRQQVEHRTCIHGHSV